MFLHRYINCVASLAINVIFLSLGLAEGNSLTGLLSYSFLFSKVSLLVPGRFHLVYVLTSCTVDLLCVLHGWHPSLWNEANVNRIPCPNRNMHCVVVIGLSCTCRLSIDCWLLWSVFLGLFFGVLFVYGFLWAFLSFVLLNFFQQTFLCLFA